MATLRQQTADLLNNGCGCGPMPPPQGTMPLSVFEELLWKTAYNNGYTSTKGDFLEDLAALVNGSRLGIPAIISQCGSYRDFPSIGSEGVLYFDTENRKLYLWVEDKGYVQAVGSSGVVGEITEEEVIGCIEGKVFSGGNAESDF